MTWPNEGTPPVMTEQHEILSKLPAQVRDSLTARSVEVWTFIYNYIEQHGYADTVDESFTDELWSRFELSARAAGTHLRRMRRADLLQGWEGTLGRGQTSPRLSFIMGIPPTRIMRYTLPGRKPPREMYRQEKTSSNETVANDRSAVDAGAALYSHSGCQRPGATQRERSCIT